VYCVLLDCNTSLAAAAECRVSELLALGGLEALGGLGEVGLAIGGLGEVDLASGVSLEADNTL
jgi:hypothetical protein